MVINLFHLRRNIIFCFLTILNDMNMYRLMVIRIELEDITEYYEYRWHNFKINEYYACKLRFAQGRKCVSVSKSWRTVLMILRVQIYKLFLIPPRKTQFFLFCPRMCISRTYTKNALRRGRLGLIPSAYSLIVIRCRNNIMCTKLSFFFENTKFLSKKS